MAVDVFDPDDANPASVARTGAPGEMVCVRPFPSQPLAFIGERGGERYKASYFERFGPRVWCQGDLIRQLPDTQGIVMLGRS